MDNEQLKSKKKIIQVIANELKDAGFYSMKSWIGGYESLEKIINKKEKLTIITDITAKYEKTLFLFEVELSKESQPAKWQTLSDHAKKCFGKLFIIIPERLSHFFNKELNKNNIEAEIVEISQ